MSVHSALVLLDSFWFPAPDGTTPSIQNWSESERVRQTRPHTTRYPWPPVSAQMGQACFCYRAAGFEWAAGNRTNGIGQRGSYKIYLNNNLLQQKRKVLYHNNWFLLIPQILNLLSILNLFHIKLNCRCLLNVKRYHKIIYVNVLIDWKIVNIKSKY